LNEAPKFYEVADAIRLRLEGSVFVSHNTEFDLGLLKKKFSEMGQELKVKNFCTLKVAQHEIPGLRNYNLDALCSFFGIKIRERHRAVGDALATLDLFRELMQLRLKTYPKILHLPHHEKILKKLPAKAGLVTFKELKADLGINIPTHGCLESWARQGVLLLNTVLTVEQGKAGSHHKKGWEEFTDKVIEILNREKENLVFILWGAPAQKKAKQVDTKKHLILKSVHPSPLSVYRGFSGSKPFSLANNYLKEKGLKEIDWSLEL
jgi:hypothetical protein